MPAPSFTGHFVLEDDAEDFAPEAVGEPRVLDDGQLEALTPEHGVVVGVDGPAHALDDHQVRLPLPHQHGQALVQAAANSAVRAAILRPSLRPQLSHTTATTVATAQSHWLQLGHHCGDTSVTPQPHRSHIAATAQSHHSPTLAPSPVTPQGCPKLPTVTLHRVTGAHKQQHLKARGINSGAV